MPDSGVVSETFHIKGIDMGAFIATQARFNGKRRPRYRISFMETVERRLGGQTLQTIAEAAGIKHQGMSIIDKRYLQHLLGGRAGELRTKRKKERQRKRAAEKKRSLALQLKGQPFCEIVRFCKQEKLAIRLEIFGNRPTLVVAKRRWRFHHLQSLWKASKQSSRSYFHAFLEEWASNCAGEIFLTEHGGVRRIFLIPQADMQKRFPKGSPGSLYFPEKKEKKKAKEGCPPRLGVWQYEDALHFLRPDFVPSAAVSPSSD